MDTRYCLHPVKIDEDRVFPCGSCPVCRMKYRKQFAVRLYMEKCLEKPDYSYFITLTYNNENIPTCSGRQCFDKDHITTFLDSMRHGLRAKGYKLRYFGTCEYGEEGYRPHYHFIFYLYSIRGCSSSGFGKHQFNKEFCQRYWRYGFTQDGTVTVRSILYVTAYALKDDEYLERDWRGFEPGRPFRVFSLRPGLGLTDKCIQWWTDFAFNDGNPRTSFRTKGIASSISSGIPTGIKRKIKDYHPFAYEYIKSANMQYFEESISQLFQNIEKYGSARDYTLKDGVDEIDRTPDEQIKNLRRAMREFRKKQRSKGGTL